MGVRAVTGVLWCGCWWLWPSTVQMDEQAGLDLVTLSLSPSPCHLLPVTFSLSPSPCLLALPKQ